MSGDLKGTGTFYNPVLTSGGKERMIQWRNSFLRDKNGKIIVTVSSGMDITEKLKAEKIIEESEKKYRILAETARDMIYIIDRDCRFLYINSFMAGLLGKKAEEMPGISGRQFFGRGGSCGAHKENIDKVLTTGKPLYTEHAVHLCGRGIWLGTWFVPIKGEKGKVSSIMGISREITDRMNAAEMLRTAAERYRTLLDIIPHGLMIVTSGRISYMNSKCAKMLCGEKENCCTGKSLLDFIPGFSRAELKKKLDLAGKGEQVWLPEQKIVLRRGRVGIFTLLLSRFPDKKERSVLITVKPV